MALDRNNLVMLAKTVAKADPSAPVSYSFNGESFTYEQLNETLRREFNEYASTYALYRENKNLIFSLIEETLYFFYFIFWNKRFNSKFIIST